MSRYSAKLLFQFRANLTEEASKRRLCEERIIVLNAMSAKSALAQAKRKGKQGQHHYKNINGKMVYFEFVGVMELLRLGSECAPDEVWYEIRERLLPMERREALIPPDKQLNALRNETLEIPTRAGRRAAARPPRS
jgi:hypothetical protein